jgi:hypothetical protein
VTVFSPASTADEAKRLRPKSMMGRHLIMLRSPFG